MSGKIIVVCFFVATLLCSSSAWATAPHGNTTPIVSVVDSAALFNTLNRDQTDSTETTNEYLPEWYDMITNIPGDIYGYGKETFQLKNIPAILGMAAATGILIVTDQQTWEAADRWYRTSPAVRQGSDIAEFIGDGKFQFGISAAFAGYGFIFHDNRAIRTASQTVEAILACGAVVQVLKHVTGRESPFVETQKGGAWRFFPNQIDYAEHVPHYDAFPSGHIATAMTTLTVIAENYPEATWIRPVFYPVLGLVATSLITTGIHWWSDIPLGVALGYSFGVICSHPELTTINKNSVNMSFLPVLYPDGAGISLNMTF
ncbi:MAG TPA: phosphatase PAP2 family protein [Candidatus Kapabacteria bacterium]|nr:phosphatase PAP2 family protein [Candidatus Kapabacteria bacterium]